MYQGFLLPELLINLRILVLETAKLVQIEYLYVQRNKPALIIKLSCNEKEHSSDCLSLNSFSDVRLSQRLRECKFYYKLPVVTTMGSLCEPGA